ncbi:MAG: hypothetical protein AAF533_10870 [Acidobacteriota bacterium]
MRSTVVTLSTLLVLLFGTSQAQAGLSLGGASAIPPCGSFDILDTGISPGSGYDADPSCDIGSNPGPNGCGGSDLVLASQQELDRFWGRHRPGETAPSVDFTTEVVLAVLLGERSNTGFSIHVSCVRYVETVDRNGDTVLRSAIVEVDDNAAGVHCIVQPAISNPYDIVVIDRPASGSNGRPNVTFVHSSNVFDCPAGGDCPGDPGCPCRICPDGGGSSDVGQNDGIPCCP